MQAELKLQINTQPGLAELEGLVATLEQVIADAPHLRLQILDHLFTGSDHSFKAGFIDLIAVPTTGAGGPPVIELHVADRFRKLVAAAVANELQLLSID